MKANNPHNTIDEYDILRRTNEYDISSELNTVTFSCVFLSSPKMMPSTLKWQPRTGTGHSEP